MAVQKYFCVTWINVVFLLIHWIDLSLTVDIPVLQEQYHCSHRPPSQQEVIFDARVNDGEPGHVQKRSVYENLRIHLHYDDSVHNLPYSQEKLVKEMVNEAVLYWENALMVRPGVLPVRLNRQCSSIDTRYKNNLRFCVNGCSTVTYCGDIRIPEAHLERCYLWNSFTNDFRSTMTSGPGVENKDFVLYVAATSTARCQGSRTIAYAAHCQLEHQLDRPVAGYFTICPETISTKTQDHLQLQSTIKHEILHALGFTAGLYAFYRDDYGSPLTPRFSESNKPPFNSQLGLYQWSENVVKTVKRKDWKVAKGYMTHTVNLIVTPKVVQEVRQHFNCPSLEGAELENQGLIGTALTHWEKRVFENEAMTGTYTQNPVISRITLALMEDTGWYRANYHMAEHLEWGAGLGCDFVQKSCLEWMDTHHDIHPFCNTVLEGMLVTDCTRNRNAYGYCNLKNYGSALPVQYQYFRDLEGKSLYAVHQYGGAVALADYCPYLQEFSWKDSYNRTLRDSRCQMEENHPTPLTNFFGESYGQGSLCFNHAGQWRIRRCNIIHPVSHMGSGCYKYDCENNQGLVIIVNYRSYLCLKAGQKIHISYIANGYLYDGYIICPACHDICNFAGYTCPPDREPYDIVNDRHLRVPCSATKLQHFQLIFVLFLMLLCFSDKCQS